MCHPRYAPLARRTELAGTKTVMERKLAAKQDLISRHEDRHSHIGIRLQWRATAQWERLEALGWNAVGFNFYQAQEIRQPVLEFKRGLTRFEGSIVWSAPNTSDDVLRSALVNELIFRRAKELTGNAVLYARLLKLIRVYGMVAQKREILASLGVNVTDERLAELIDQRRQEHPMFHYGVQVASDAWSAIVKDAFSVSSVLISLDKWSAALGKR